MSKAPATPAAAPEAPASGGKSKLLIIVIAVLVVLLVGAGGAAAYLFMHQSSAKATVSKKKADDSDSSSDEDPGKPPVFVTLDPFTVNLTPDESGADKYLQVALSVQVRDDKAADTFKAHMPQIRDRMQMLLSAQKASVLLTTDGKEALKKSIIDTLSQPYEEDGPHMKIKGVAFTSFIIQ